MTRHFEPISASEMTEAQRAVAKKLLSGPRKAIAGPFQALLRSPELADAVQQTGEYLRFKSNLPDDLKEFAILISARRWTSQFEWYFHKPLALQAGLKASVIDSLANGDRPDLMTEDQELVFEFSTQLLSLGRPSDDLTDRVIERFGEHGCIDLIGTVGFYCLISMVLNVADVLVPGNELPLAPRAKPFG
jgi:4-carboxymuconolactone decarboxylase